MRNKIKMDIKIDEDVIKSTTKCRKDFRCLSDKNYEFCKVTQSTHHNVIFIECLESNFCIYKTFFGYSSYICKCPVRRELYRKYNI
jgi:hypothetical protein